MAATNGIAKRIDALERAAIDHYARQTHSREMLADRLARMAARRQAAPERPGSSAADRVVREALAASEGTHDPRFWRAVRAGLRRYLKERAA